MYPKHRSLFPYKNRSLGMGDFITPKEERGNSIHLIKILISNLVVGDEIQFPKAKVTVSETGSDGVSYKADIVNGEVMECCDTIENLEKGILFTAFESIFNESLENFTSNFYKLIERDPAIFRLQSGTGWVINDELCLSTGNVSYKDIESKVVETPLSPPNTVKPTEEIQQNAFDF